MLKKRNLVFAMMVIMMIAVMVGCQTVTPTAAPTTAPTVAPTTAPTVAPTAAPKNYRIAYCTIILTNPFQQTITEAAKAAAKPGDVVDVYSANVDPNKQIADVEDCVTKKYDMILLDNFNAQSIKPALDTAKAAGIPIFFIDSPPAYPELGIAFVGADHTQMGELSAESLAKAMNGTGVIAKYTEDSSGPIRMRTAGFDSVINATKYPNIKVLEFSGIMESDVVQGNVENFLQAHPEINAFYMPNDGSVAGCLAALDGAGLLGKVLVAGGDGSAKDMEFIKAGKMLGTSCMQPALMAQTAMETVYKYFAGEKFEKEIIVPVTYTDATNVK